MTADKNAYRDTLNLPQTDFPMRAGLPKQERLRLEQWAKEDIYNELRRRREGREKFILHLGPPYANGNMHMGHALTYVLKDFIVRAKFMGGFDAPYVPGWDCHGLPIEWKVEEQIRAEGKTKEDFTKKEIRDRCRTYAQGWIETQSEEWQRFGCIGDFENPYKTMDYKNEAGIARELGKMMTGGYLYKGFKSIMWSPVEETALAEAEIEYDDNHESTAIYVTYPVVGKENEFVVIWTTTPWTMPASKAVCYHPDLEYVLITPTEVHEKAVAKTGHNYWITKNLLEDFTKMCGMLAYEEVGSCKGTDFENITANHPFYDYTVPMIPGDHVTAEAGTGFVHTAPAHGADDFEMGKAFNLDTECHVDGKGCYDEEVGDLPKTGVTLTGVNIWDAKKPIIAELTEQGALLRWYKMKHSYPVSWRSKKPLIFRTTPQWYANLDKDTGKGTIRQNALNAIHGENGVTQVRWVPEYGERRIGGMIADRPDWCLSRQRVWGVPITIFRDTKNDRYIDDAAVFEHIAGLIEQEGIDAWDSRIAENRVAELLPTGWLDANSLTVDDLEPESDILDVWFDSGTTHAHVVRAREDLRLGDKGRAADMYLEGSDQHRGWFHSSLLTSCANYGDAPYKTVLTNGFVVDGEGKKMSKSVGNVMSPIDLSKQYGMDIVRLWVAAADYNEDIRISDEIIKNSADAYRRFRNTFRFLLGNLSDFDANQHSVAYEDMPELEKYVLHQLHSISIMANADYDNYKFHKVYQAFYSLCNETLSNFYFDVRKDSLYCDAKVETAESADQYTRRRACQTVLHHILKTLCTYMAPIMSFTTDETWRASGEQESVHLQEFHAAKASWNRENDETFLDTWQTALELRDAVNLKREELRAKGDIGHDYEAAATIPQAAWDKVDHITELADIFLVSQLKSGTGDEVMITKAQGEKCQRCWKYTENLSGDDTAYPGVSPRDLTALQANATAAEAAA